jgi:hypothetical protein
MKIVVDPSKSTSLLKTVTVKYPHLWEISLCNVPRLATNDLLSFLSHFIALGFLDLSFTDVTLDTLQKALRHTTVMSLHIFQCESLELNEIGSKTLALDSSYGFLIYSLPLTWCINGNFVSFTERKHWTRYWETGPGKHSAIYRMHVNMRQTRKEGKPATMILINPWGKELMRRIPVKFTMVLRASFNTKGQPTILISSACIIQRAFSRRSAQL